LSIIAGVSGEDQPIQSMLGHISDAQSAWRADSPKPPTTTGYSPVGRPRRAVRTEPIQRLIRAFLENTHSASVPASGSPNSESPIQWTRARPNSPPRRVKLMTIGFFPTVPHSKKFCSGREYGHRWSSVKWRRRRRDQGEQHDRE
jgi:hypothetical protein